MLKLSMEKSLNTKLILSYPNVSNFMLDQDLSLEKEDKYVLLLPHTRYTKNNK